MTLRAIAALSLITACAPADDTPGATCDGLLAGDLVLTEVFADHAGTPGGDEGFEWIEIYGASSEPVELDGVVLVHGRPDGSREKRFVFDGGAVEPGGYLVAGSAVADETGALPAYVGVSYGDRLGDLFNSGGGRLALICGATTVDEAIYGDATAGRSIALDGGAPPDYTLNDDAARWCAAGDDTAFDADNRGTPGAANRSCGAVLDGTCDDGGTRRAIAAPAPGDLVLSEVMPNPLGADGDAEWLELRATRGFDLNGLVIDAAGDHDVLASDRCLSVAAGSHVLLARSDDPAINGGLPAPAAVVDVGLPNRDGSVSVLGADGAVLDSLAWTTSRDGVAIAVDPSSDAARCDATIEYGPGGRGTPGAENDCGRCRDRGVLRPIQAPGLLDLEIAEWMANPEGMPSDRGEYVELRASAPVDLNGIQLGRRADALEAPLTSAECLHLEPGDSAVFVHAGGDVTGADGAFAFALVQSSGSIVVSHGGAVVDEITYASSTPARATIVDERGRTCTVPADAAYRYNGTDHGTPRQPNPDCAP